MHLSLSVFVARRSLSESATRLSLLDRATAAKTNAHSLALTRYCTRAYTHSHTHRADRQHDFILQSGFSARYDGGEPSAGSRGQNVSWFVSPFSLCD